MKHLIPHFRILLRQYFAALVLLFSYYTSSAMAAEYSAVAEYKLKAALIYKLTGFVEWPERINTSDTDKFGICVLGRDDFGNSLDGLEGRVVGDYPITIKRFAQSSSINSECQIVFISESKKAYLTEISKALLQYPILTIGDSENFAEKGGMLQFTEGDKRIGFKVNLVNAKLAGLKIAAPFLKICTVVNFNQTDHWQ